LSNEWYSVVVITNEQKNKIAEIAKRHKLALVVLFGSQATGHTHRRSDVDIGYVADKEIDYRENYEISMEMARIFKNPDVELVNIYNVAPDFKKQIADTGIVLYDGNESVFDLFKIHANRIYMETKSLRDYRLTYIKSFLQRYAQ